MKHRSRPAPLEPLEVRRLLSAAVGDVEANDFALLQRRQGPSTSYTPAAAGAVSVGPLAGVVGGTAGTARQPTGALTGKIVYTVGGHGFVSDNATGWHTQRDEVAGTEMVEDLGNQDQMTFYVNHLFNAGATVVPLRPVGYQPNEVVMDNDDPGVTYSGTWSNSSSTVFYGSAGDVPYRFATAAATQTATATYTPTISVAGFYPVYTWVHYGSDRTNQLYRVNYAGGSSDVRVDHSRVGDGFVYLGTYYFNAGTSGNVTISNLRSDANGSVVIADTIRFGNGMGDIARGGLPSGQTRSDESALYWIEAQKGQGIPDTEFRVSADDDTANVGAPPRWAAHMNREVVGAATERLFLSFHSNSDGGRGDLGLFNGNNVPSTATPNQFAWASLVGKEVNDDMVAQAGKYEYNWFNNSSPTLDRSDIEFGEINNSYINDEFDATILEVAYHDDLMDAALMRDPKVRDAVARASLQATIKYFNQFNAGPLVMPPDSPTNARAAAQSNGDVTVSWNAPAANGVVGDAASGYVIYTSPNGYGFGNAITVASGATLTYTIPAAQVAGATYFRVAATNAGGESMQTEVLAARGVASSGKILIVNGFDRLTRQQNPLQHGPTTYTPPLVPDSTTFERVRPRFSNSFDYAVQAAEAIKNYSLLMSFDTTSNEAVIAGQVNLKNYGAVIWMSGEESTADHTFDATEQSLVTSYINAGGKLFVSGSEIAYDLDFSAHGVSFYNNQLKADFVGDDAATYTASGAGGSIFSGISLSFDNGTSGTYDVNFPDQLAAFGGSTIAMNYTGGGGGGAATQYANTTTGSKIVNMGFPFETITTAAARNSVMSAVLNYFALSSGTISGVTWQDFNDNGVQDAGEPLLPGATVTVWKQISPNGYQLYASTTSDANAQYWFSSLPAGTYRLDSLGTGYVPLTDQTDMTVPGSGLLAGRNLALFPTTINGTAAADQYYARADAAKTRLEISLGNAPAATPTYSVRKNKVYQIGFHLGGGDDTLTVDFSNGAPTGGSYVDYYGDANGTAAGDLLRVIGTTAADHFIVQGGNYHIDSSANLISSSSVLDTVERVVIDAGAGNDSLDLYNGAPAVAFNGQTSTTADTMNLNGVAYTFSADAALTTNSLQLNVSTGSTATFDATQHLAGLAVSGTATLSAGGAKVLVTNALSITGSGKLNLTDNDLIFTYAASSPIGSWTGSAYTGVLGMIASGRNGGAWSGNGIVTTSASGNFTTLGVAEASQVLGLSGGATALFDGQTVDDTTVLVKYTYGGDANLDGKINVDDYTRIDFNVPLSSTAWFNGDFNYDGKINVDDYTVIDFNVGIQGSTL